MRLMSFTTPSIVPMTISLRQGGQALEHASDHDDDDDDSSQCSSDSDSDADTGNEPTPGRRDRSNPERWEGVVWRVTCQATCALRTFAA